MNFFRSACSLFEIDKMYVNYLRGIQELDKPILFVSGTRDELIPPTQMTELFEKCSSEKKEIFRVQGGDHNGTWQKGGEQYILKVGEFLNRLPDV